MVLFCYLPINSIYIVLSFERKESLCQNKLKYAAVTSLSSLTFELLLLVIINIINETHLTESSEPRNRHK